jgi:hypothetical protein
VTVEPEGDPNTNAPVAGARRPYQAYLLRLWQEQRDGQTLWRASLENPHTGERLGFAGLTQLFAYLQKQAGSLPPVQAPDSKGR